MLRRKFAQIIACGLVSCAFGTSALAQERGSFDEAKAMVMKGLEHIKKVGHETAFKDFTEDKANWNNKDIYLFAVGKNGVMTAHGVNAKQVGKDFWEVKDANGKLLFQEFTKIVEKGSGNGSVEYEWAHPTTKKIETKISYIAKVPNTDYYIGAGAYK